MKFVHIISGLAVTFAVAGCAHKAADIPVPAPSTSMTASADQSSIAQPNVSGSVLVRQGVMLPANSVLTVTLSDATQADARSIVIAQKVVRTNGNQPPYSFVLPFNPADIKPNARIILSAAVAVDNKLVLVTNTVQPALNGAGNKINLTLVPVEQTAVPVQSGGAASAPAPEKMLSAPAAGSMMSAPAPAPASMMSAPAPTPVQ